MRERTARRGAVVLLAVAALAAIVWLGRQWPVDRCLDAGGRRSAAAEACEGSEPSGDRPLDRVER